MNPEYIVAIVAFVAGGAAVSWLSSRSASNRDREPEAPDPAAADAPAVETPAVEPADAPHAASGLGAIPVTIAFIAVCVVIALLSKLGEARNVLAPLYFADPDAPGFRAILGGEVWRLVTPAFIHFGVLHLLFNMMWLWDLGATLERIKGHAFVFWFVLGVGSAANLAQFLVTGSPLFGGMSGVVYGFLGYVWMQGRVNPRFGVALSQHTVVMMLIWFALCWMGVLGPIANWAHTAGLGLGVALGLRQPGGRN